MSKISKELIGASSIPIILSIISKKDAYGYEIIQKVKELSDGKIAYKDGSLYPVLHKIEKKGYIKSYWKESESGKKRKYYTICEEGKREIVTEKENWSIINQIISKLWKIEPNLA